jgi:GNAT superfamily N-acetyltransferase
MTSLVEMEEVGPAELTDAELDLACGWFASLDPEFFAAFGLDEPAAAAVMRAMLLDPESEYGVTRFFRHDSQLAGAFTAYPANQILGRRSVLLRDLIRRVGRVGRVDRAVVGGHAAGGQSIARRAGCYISKLYVARDYRRFGLGTQLMERVLDRHGREGVCFHLHKSNARAIKFHEAFRFEQTQDEHPDFLLMIGNPDARPSR